MENDFQLWRESGTFADQLFHATFHGGPLPPTKSPRLSRKAYKGSEEGGRPIGSMTGNETTFDFSMLDRARTSSL